MNYHFEAITRPFGKHVVGSYFILNDRLAKAFNWCNYLLVSVLLVAAPTRAIMKKSIQMSGSSASTSDEYK